MTIGTTALRLSLAMAVCVTVSAAATAAQGRAYQNGGQTESARSRGQAAQTAEYRDVLAFQARVSLEPSVVAVEQTLWSLAEHTHQPLFYGGPEARLSLAAAAADVPAADLLDAMERATGLRWFLTHESGYLWVLAPSRDQARAGAREHWLQEERKGHPSRFSAAAYKTLDQFVSGLTPQQCARLEAGEKLTPKNLTPRQWGVLRSAMILFMRDPNGPYAETPRPEALGGQVVMWLASNGPKAPELWIDWPNHDGGPNFVAVMYFIERRDNGTYARPEFPERVPVRTRPAATEARRDYHLDKQLAARLAPNEVTWGALVTELYSRTGAAFLFSGPWLLKPVPFATKDRKASEVMDEIAALGGGDWQAVGSTWVLVPHPKKASGTK